MFRWKYGLFLRGCFQAPSNLKIQKKDFYKDIDVKIKELIKITNQTSKEFIGLFENIRKELIPKEYIQK